MQVSKFESSQCDKESKREGGGGRQKLRERDKGATKKERKEPVAGNEGGEESDNIVFGSERQTGGVGGSQKVSRQRTPRVPEQNCGKSGTVVRHLVCIACHQAAASD